MYLDKLSLLNFKNIAEAEVEFSHGINCLVGSNGAGKTNLIDAVYYLSMCKSSLTMTDGQSLRHGEEFFMLSGQYTADDGRGEKVVCSFKRTAGKTVKRGGKEYERLADHIGVVPVVIVSPSDVFLVNDAADQRRKWLNGFISQLDGSYLDAAVRYNRLLAERNKLLKQLNIHANLELLDVLDQRLVPYGRTIHRLRGEVIEHLQPLAAEYYRIISGDSEQVELGYMSELGKSEFGELLSASRQKDIICQFSTSGIHRDDMTMKIGSYPLRKYGSQGQQKSFLIALKLAQYSILAAHDGERPILLLDDVFDKLDRERLERLISLTCDGRFGQIIISDCNRDRLESVLESCGVDYRLFTVSDGAVNREK